MRNLPTIRQLWEETDGKFVGDKRAHGRVTVESAWTLTMTGQVYGSSDKGPYRWFYREDQSQSETEVPNIKSITINRNLDKDAADCTIVIYNQWLDDNGDPPPNTASIGNPGYLGYNFGVSPEASALFGQTTNMWENILIPNALIRTFQGYGGWEVISGNFQAKPLATAISEGNIAITGVWLIDKVTLGTDGLIRLQCRDTAKLLIDQSVFVPLVPDRYYPLKYQRYVEENIAQEPARAGEPGSPAVADEPSVLDIATLRHRDSSTRRWLPAIEGDMGRGGVVLGQPDSNAWDGREDTWSISSGASHWNNAWAKDWWEADIGGSTGALINEVYISAAGGAVSGIPFIGGGYPIWISIMEDGHWQKGTSISTATNNVIPWDDANGDGKPDTLVASMGAAAVPVLNTDINYVLFGSVQNGLTENNGEWYQLDRVYKAQRIRITMAPLWETQWGPNFWRSGLRKVAIKLTNVDPIGSPSGSIPTFIGGSVTRGDAIALIHDFTGSRSGSPNSGFIDVSAFRHLEAVNWAKEFGITTGSPPGSNTFLPDNPISRAEFVTFLYRTAGSPTGAPAHPFLDVLQSYQNVPLDWAFDTGVTTGTSSNTFAPDVPATPDQVSTFLSRFGAAVGNPPPAFWAIADVTDPAPAPPPITIIHDGNLRDWVDPVRDLFLWAGFLFFETSPSAGADVHGVLEFSGSWPEDVLGEDVFDKKTVIDAINTIKEVLGYIFFVDEEGGVRFHSPNWWTSGNFTNGDHVTYVPELLDTQQLTDYSTTYSDDLVRSEILLGNIPLDEESFERGESNTHFDPNSLITQNLLRGMVKPAIWINEVFTNADEQRLMAALIGLHLLFQSKTGQVTALAHPEIQVNDQVRISERNSGESYIHYVRGLRTDMDLDTGAYLMTLTTNWLGEEGDWVFDRDALLNLFSDAQLFSSGMQARLSPLTTYLSPMEIYSNQAERPTFDVPIPTPDPGVALAGPIPLVEAVFIMEPGLDHPFDASGRHVLERGDTEDSQYLASFVGYSTIGVACISSTVTTTRPFQLTPTLDDPLTDVLDFRAIFYSNNYTSGFSQYLIQKYTPIADRRIWGFRVSGGGFPALVWSDDGATTATETFDSLTLTDGVAYAVRLVIDIAGGTAEWEQHLVSDAINDDWSQTPIATESDTHSLTTLHVDSSVPIGVGARWSADPEVLGVEEFEGIIAYAQVRDGDGILGGLDLPGASGDFAHTPDSASVSVTGDIDIQAEIVLDDWTPLGQNTIVAKRDGSTQISFRFYVNTNGRIGLSWSEDGAVQIHQSSTVAISPEPGAGTKLHVRTTLDVDNGASGNDNVYYTSTDGVSWTQLGATVTTAGVTSIFDSTVRLTVGSHDDDGNGTRLSGSVRSAQVYSGISGTLVADFDPNRDANLSNAPFVSSTTGETWTVAGNASVNGRIMATFDPNTDAGLGITAWTDSTTLDTWGYATPPADQADWPRAGIVLDLPGTSGDFAHTPDTVTVSIEGDLEIICHMTLDQVDSGNHEALVAKWNTSGDQRSFIFRRAAAGNLRILTSVDGIANSLEIGSSVDLSTVVSDLESTNVRVTMDVDDGAGNNVVKFYTSTDGISWIQLGVTKTTAGVTSIFDSTALVTIGATLDDGSNQMLSGTIHSAQIYADPFRTSRHLVADFNPFRDAEAGDKVLDLPGATGDYVSTSDSAAVSVTDDIQIDVHVTMDDWTPPAVAMLAGKWLDGGDNRSFNFRVETSGLLTLANTTDGTFGTNNPRTSTVAPTVSNGEDLHVRVTLDVDAGSTDHNVTFYTSSDGDSWAQLGDVVNAAGVTSIFDGTSKFAFGSLPDNSSVAGKIHSGQLYDGIGGALVADFDATRDAVFGHTSVTSSTTGENWTVAGSAAIAITTVPSSTTDEVWTIAGDASIVGSVLAENLGGKLVFDGGDWLVTTLTPTFTKTTGEFTVFIVTTPDAIGGNGDKIVSSESANDNGFSLSINGDETFIRCIVGFSSGDRVTKDTGSNLTAGIRAAAAMIVDDGTLAAYDNIGGLTATSSITGITGTIAHDPVVIGARAHDDGLPYNGTIETILVFERALTEAELNTISNSYGL